MIKAVKEFIPVWVYLRLQWQLFVTEKQFGYLAAVCGSELRIYPFKKKRKEILFLSRLAHQFWDHVEKRDPPRWIVSKRELDQFTCENVIVDTRK